MLFIRLSEYWITLFLISRKNKAINYNRLLSNPTSLRPVVAARWCVGLWITVAFCGRRLRQPPRPSSHVSKVLPDGTAQVEVNGPRFRLPIQPKLPTSRITQPAIAKTGPRSLGRPRMLRPCYRPCLARDRASIFWGVIWNLCYRKLGVFWQINFPCLRQLAGECLAMLSIDGSF